MSLGKLISFEGIDGAGKTTQIEMLKNHYLNKGIPVRYFREPGSTSLAEQIRAILLTSDEDIDPVTEAFLFSTARSSLMYQKILPALEEDNLVILDRFYDSTIAYQGFVKGMNIEDIDAITQVAIQGRQPDKTIYLHITPEVSMQRRESIAMDRMEKSVVELTDVLYNAYESLAEKYPDRIVKVDGNRPEAIIQADILDIVDELYK